MATAAEAGAAPPRLTVYSRASCHLCEEMVAGLAALQGRFSFTLELVDVDGDSVLRERYGEDVPVLAHGGRELCRHRLDGPRVGAYLSGLPVTQAVGC